MTRTQRFGALLIAAAFALPAWVGSATGQTETRSVTVSPSDGLVDGQYVAIGFSGFPPGEDVRARQCPKKARSAADCKPDGQSLRESGLTRVNSSGAGNLSLIVRSGELTSVAGKEFRCDLKHACNMVIFELDQDTGDELGFDRSAPTPLPFAASTLACPKPKGTRVAGSGGTSPAASVVEWQAATCGEPLDLQVSYIVTNSPNGKEAFVSALTDSEFAVSAIALDEEEKQALATATREPVQIPVTVGSLSFAYNYWEDFDRCDSDTVREQVGSLRFSPETLAMVITGRLGNMNHEMIANDNPHLVARTKMRDESGNCAAGTALPSRIVKPVGRADNSGATWILSSWMLASAKEAWESAGPDFQNGPTEIFPSYNFVDLRTGSAAVARQVKTFDGGQGIGDIPDAMWIGYVDTSVGRQLGLPSVAVKNGAGEFVAPSTESVHAALEAATLNDDGAVTPNYAATAPNNLYPLLVVSYLITDKNKLSTRQADMLKAFSAYAVTDGQEGAEQRGYAPLPAELQTSAAASIREIQGVGGEGGGGGPGGTPDGPGGAGGASGGDDEASDDGSGLDTFTDGRLAALGAGAGSTGGSASALGGAAGAAATEGPIEEALATQKLGPAGGPAGVVRALTVFLGVPLLVAMGLASIVGGRTLMVMSDEGGFRLPALVPRLRWRRAT